MFMFVPFYLFILLFEFSNLALASDFREMQYQHKSSVVVWHSDAVHVICSICTPPGSLSYTKASKSPILNLSQRSIVIEASGKNAKEGNLQPLPGNIKQILPAFSSNSKEEERLEHQAQAEMKDDVRDDDISRGETENTFSAKTSIGSFAVAVNFEFDKFKISDTEIEKISKVIRDVKSENFNKIEISGYTDRLGNEQYNKKLALKRAESIKDFLVLHGINKDKIKVEGKGKCCFISDKESENRRVEILFERR